MKGTRILICLVTLTLSPCVGADLFPALGQGQMAGRVTANSVILQSRLTQGHRLTQGDLPGLTGVACFEVSTHRDCSL